MGTNPKLDVVKTKWMEVGLDVSGVISWSEEEDKG